MAAFKEFKEFILRGNMIDLAVGVIIGGVLNRVVQSLVNDIIMPPIGLLLGRVDFANLFLLLRVGEPAGPYATLAEAQEEPTTKTCAHCFTTIPTKATRCPNCTTQLEGGQG